MAKRELKYQVIKDGHIVGQYAQLASALKKAEIIEADVYEGVNLIQSAATIAAQSQAVRPEMTEEEKAIRDGIVKPPASEETEKPVAAIEAAVQESEKEAEMCKAVKILTHLYVRVAPDKGAKPIGTLDFGQVVDVTAWKGDWFQHKYQGRWAWSMYGNGKYARKL